MQQVPYNITPDSITVFCNGRMHTVLADRRTEYEELAEHLRGGDHDPAVIENLANREVFVSKKVAGVNGVEVKHGTVFYMGDPIHSTLTSKLLRMLDEGYDVTPWTNFLGRLMLNPSYRSRESLYDFLDHFNAPITPEGKFIAFKRIRQDWTDVHTGKFDNSIGTRVQMPRHLVDDDNQRTCSAGLHVCADEYLSGFATGSSYRTVVVEVCPSDVVSVPYDYNFSKMRCCEYKVLAEIDSGEVDAVLEEEVYGYDYEGYGVSDYDDYYDEEEYNY